MPHGLIIDNCWIEGIVGTQAGFGYGINASGNHLTIQNNRIFAAESGRHGIYVTFAQHVDILHNFVEGFKSAGIAFNTDESKRLQYIKVHGNELHSCCVDSKYGEDAAMGVWGQRINTPSHILGAEIEFTRDMIYSTNCTLFFATRCLDLLFESNHLNYDIGSDKHQMILKFCNAANVLNKKFYAAPQFKQICLELIQSYDTFVNQNRFNAVGARAHVRNNKTVPVSTTILGTNYDVGGIGTEIRYE